MNERTRHHEVLEIALQTGTPEQEVNRLYDEVLQRLATGALIHDYLLLLASKHVRHYLKTKYRAPHSLSL